MFSCVHVYKISFMRVFCTGLLLVGLVSSCDLFSMRAGGRALGALKSPSSKELAERAVFCNAPRIIQSMLPSTQEESFLRTPEADKTQTMRLFGSLAENLFKSHFTINGAAQNLALCPLEQSSVTSPFGLSGVSVVSIPTQPIQSVQPSAAESKTLTPPGGELAKREAEQTQGLLKAVTSLIDDSKKDVPKVQPFEKLSETSLATSLKEQKSEEQKAKEEKDFLFKRTREGLKAEFTQPEVPTETIGGADYKQSFKPEKRPSQEKTFVGGKIKTSLYDWPAEQIREPVETPSYVGGTSAFVFSPTVTPASSIKAAGKFAEEEEEVQEGAPRIPAEGESLDETYPDEESAEGAPQIPNFTLPIPGVSASRGARDSQFFSFDPRLDLATMGRRATVPPATVPTITPAQESMLAGLPTVEDILLGELTGLPTAEGILFGAGSRPLIEGLPIVPQRAPLSATEATFLGGTLNAVGNAIRAVPGTVAVRTISGAKLAKVLDLGKKHNLALVWIKRDSLPASVVLEGPWSAIFNGAGQQLAFLGHTSVNGYLPMAVDRGSLLSFGSGVQDQSLIPFGDGLPEMSRTAGFLPAPTAQTPTLKTPVVKRPRMEIPTAQGLFGAVQPAVLNLPALVVQGHVPVITLPKKVKVSPVTPVDVIPTQPSAPEPSAPQLPIVEQPKAKLPAVELPKREPLIVPAPEKQQESVSEIAPATSRVSVKVPERRPFADISKDLLYAESSKKIAEKVEEEKPVFETAPIIVPAAELPKIEPLIVPVPEKKQELAPERASVMSPVVETAKVLPSMPQPAVPMSVEQQEPVVPVQIPSLITEIPDVVSVVPSKEEKLQPVLASAPQIQEPIFTLPQIIPEVLVQKVSPVEQPIAELPTAEPSVPQLQPVELPVVELPVVEQPKAKLPAVELPKRESLIVPAPEKKQEPGPELVSVVPPVVEIPKMLPTISQQVFSLPAEQEEPVATQEVSPAPGISVPSVPQEPVPVPVIAAAPVSTPAAAEDSWFQQTVTLLQNSPTIVKNWLQKNRESLQKMKKESPALKVKKPKESPSAQEIKKVTQSKKDKTAPKKEEVNCELKYRKMLFDTVKNELNVEEYVVNRWTYCGGPLQSKLSIAKSQEKALVIFRSYNKILKRAKLGSVDARASLDRVKSTIFTVLGESPTASETYDIAQGLAKMRNDLATSITEFLKRLRGNVSSEINNMISRWQRLIGS
jgi:hypothetical protein